MALDFLKGAAQGIVGSSLKKVAGNLPGLLGFGQGKGVGIPSSTSQQTYKIRIYTSGGTASFNCTQNDSNNGYQPRTASSITVSEIA